MVTSCHRNSLLLMAFCLLFTGCAEKAPQLRNGEAAPSFTLPLLDQTALSFPEQLRGNVVLLRFWADWCAFCETEMRAIEPVYRRYREQGLVILAVNVGQDRATAQAFVDKLNISYDTLLDSRGEVARAYGVLGLPASFLIDRKGRLYRRVIGESTPDLVEQSIRELL